MELLVYKASAGSGKTFRLAVEFIRHLIADPKSYKQILAVTFTNKATTEMKERILQQLYGIWKEDPDSDAYLSCIQEYYPSMSQQELRQRAGIALQYMIHDYNRFRVETIDSFFQSVMRNLARELELTPNLTIEINNTEILKQAVEEMMDKLTPTSPVLNWILDYIKERIRDDKQWNISKELKKFANNIFDESYIERGEKLRHRLKTPGYIQIYKNVIEEILEKAVNDMSSFYDQFEGVLEDYGLTSDLLKGGSKGIGSYFRKLRDGKLSDKDVLNKTLEASLQSSENWASKTSTYRSKIINVAENHLMPILHDAERMRPANCKKISSCRLSLRHLYKLQLLINIDEEVRRLNQDHNRFLLSDTTILLHQLLGEGDSSFVFEKLGANIKNIMIDEFQDTSRMQWENFRLLLLEGLSQGADSLIVGDVKQSIYRWRNGDWGILNGLGKEKEASSSSLTIDPSMIRIETLTTNRRSEANIIEFNNSFFFHAVNYLNQKYKDELNEDCLPLLEAYADVAQESPKKVKKGYVKASFIMAKKREEYEDITLLNLGVEVARLLAQGLKTSDMAILVRKNKVIPKIAEYFDRVLHINVVSDEAFLLSASEAVLALIHALRYLANPAEKIAAYALQQTLGHALPEAFTERREELKLMPLYELLEELYQLFELHKIPHQEAYLFAFFDAANEYLQTNPSDIDSFLTCWDEKLCTKAITSGEIEGIRILSIHKSKGLEYHTVLIPFCDWNLENETNDHLVWCKPDVSPFNGLDLVPVNYNLDMKDSIYRKDFLNERLQLWVDNLNVLYVAFTRAKQNLIVWSRKDQSQTISELLQGVMLHVNADLDGDWNEEEGIFESGEFDLPTSKKGHKKSVSKNKLVIQATPYPIAMKSSQHEVQFQQSNRSADFIAGVSEAASKERFINRGKLLHQIFAAIPTHEEADSAITRLVFEGIIGSAKLEQEIRQLTKQALSHPQVNDWYSGNWKLFNECEIIWLEDGKLQHKRPDRVMMRPGEIVVVDFKFGMPRKRYLEQVRGYMNLLTKMGYDSKIIRGYLWYVDQEKVEEVKND